MALALILTLAFFSVWSLHVLHIIGVGSAGTPKSFLPPPLTPLPNPKKNKKSFDGVIESVAPTCDDGSMWFVGNHQIFLGVKVPSETNEKVVYKAVC